MKVQLAAHVRKLSGKQGDLVFIQSKTGVFARSLGRQCRHASESQLLMRGYMAEANRHWKELDRYQRYAWNQYAREYFGVSNLGRAVAANGASIFAKAAIVRQALGLPINLSAPKEGRPDNVIQYDQIPDLGEHSIGLRISDIPPDPQGYALAMRITKPLADVYFDPNRRAYRYCCGIGPASVKPFPTDGGEIVFSGIQWPIPTGSYFGIELHLVRLSDGIAGPAVASIQVKE